MKEEIEKILDDCEEDQHQAWVMDKEKATIQLQKLFLSKQIELLTEINNASGWVATCNRLIDRLDELKSELKQLQ